MVADCCNPSISHSPPYSEELLSLYIATVHSPPHKIYYVRWNVWLAYLCTQKCPEGFSFLYRWTGECDDFTRMCVCERALVRSLANWKCNFSIFSFHFTLYSLLSFFKKILKKKKNDTIWVFHNDSIENRVGLLFIHQLTDKKFDFLLCGAFFYSLKTKNNFVWFERNIKKVEWWTPTVIGLGERHKKKNNNKKKTTSKRLKSKWVGHCVHGESHVRIPSPATAVIDAVFRHPREKRNFQIVKVLILLLFYSSTDNKKHGAEGDRETMMGICRKNDNTTTLVKTLCHVSLSHRRMRSRNERI